MSLSSTTSTQSSMSAHAHEAFMALAFEQAQLALEANEVPVGCVFVKNGEVIASGFNATNKTGNGTRHAELVALDEWCSTHEVHSAKHTRDQFSDVDLYVTCEPCIMCTHALRIYGIRKAYFGCKNDKFGGCGSVLRLHDVETNDGTRPFDIESGFSEQRAIDIFKNFYERGNPSAPDHKRARRMKTVNSPTSPS